MSGGAALVLLTGTALAGVAHAATAAPAATGAFTVTMLTAAAGQTCNPDGSAHSLYAQLSVTDPGLLGNDATISTTVTVVGGGTGTYQVDTATTLNTLSANDFLTLLPVGGAAAVAPGTQTGVTVTLTPDAGGGADTATATLVNKCSGGTSTSPTASPTGSPTSSPTGSPTSSPTGIPTGTPTGGTSSTAPTVSTSVLGTDTTFPDPMSPVAVVLPADPPATGGFSDSSANDYKLGATVLVIGLLTALYFWRKHRDPLGRHR